MDNGTTGLLLWPCRMPRTRQGHEDADKMEWSVHTYKCNDPRKWTRRARQVRIDYIWRNRTRKKNTSKEENDKIVEVLWTSANVCVQAFEKKRIDVKNRRSSKATLSRIQNEKNETTNVALYDLDFWNSKCLSLYFETLIVWPCILNAILSHLVFLRVKLLDLEFWKSNYLILYFEAKRKQNGRESIVEDGKKVKNRRFFKLRYHDRNRRYNVSRTLQC